MTGAVERIEGVIIASGAPIDSLGRLDEMVLRVRRGDAEAFNEIMLETEKRVLGIAYRVLGDPEQAKDASQDAFLRAYKSLNTYRVGESFMAWIGRVTVNVCRDYLKKREHGAMAAADPNFLESMPSPDSYKAETTMLRHQHAELIQRALAALTPAERMALVLRDMEGFSTHETARALGLKEGTIRAQISMARSKIKVFCQRVLRKNKGDRP